MHLLKSERETSLFKDDEDIFDDTFWTDIFWKDIENDLESSMYDEFDWE
jgi:hypothetical protein